MNLKLVASLICLSVSVSRGADAWKLPADTARWKPGPGAPLAIANCALCHSADYISTQPRLTRSQWQATVVKMQQKYGATIATNSIAPLVEYLADVYGGRDATSK
jgi:cytochrome c553